MREMRTTDTVGDSNGVVSPPYIEILRGRDGRDGLPGRDGKDGEQGERTTRRRVEVLEGPT